MDKLQSHNIAESAMTILNKTFIWIQSLNVGAAFLAFINLVPAFAPMVTLFFSIWIGIEVVKAKKKENRKLDIEIELGERQLMIDESQG